MENLRKGYDFPYHKRELEEAIRRGGLSLKDLKITEEEIEAYRREHWADRASFHWSKLQNETWIQTLSDHLAAFQVAMREGALGPHDIGISPEELDAKVLHIKTAESGFWRYH